MDRDEILAAFDVDLSAGRLYWKRPSKFHSEKAGREAGGSRPTHAGKRYWVIRWNGVAYKRGRMIFFLANGVEPMPCVDHINGDSLDDRPSNLRAATVMQNAWNHKGRRKRLSHLPMGVRIIASSGRFQARIAYRRRMIHIGAFDTPEEAALAYQAKRKELYREFA